MLTKDEIKFTATEITKYVHLINNKDHENNIIVDGNSVKLVKYNTVLMEREIRSGRFDLDIEYCKNPFYSADSLHSPLEADRYKVGKPTIWTEYYRGIDFPKLVPLPLMTYMILGKFPDVLDTALIAMLTYTEPISEENMRSIIGTKKYFNDGYKPFLNVGKTLKYSDDREVTNRILRFKPSLHMYVKKLPFEVFTTEQYMFRIYKAYGSCIRDPYDMVRACELGATALYDLKLDLRGVDGIINGVPIYSYNNTYSGQVFREEKVTARHPYLDRSKGVTLTSVCSGCKGIHVPSDEVLRNIIGDIDSGTLVGIKDFGF